MGTSKKLHAKLSKGGLSDLPTGKTKGRADMPSIEKFIKDGLDPIHEIGRASCRERVCQYV